MKIERYRVERSKESPGWWVVTDLENLIVAKFKEKEFNERQRVTILSENNTCDASFHARVMREMADFLIENYKDIVYDTK